MATTDSAVPRPYVSKAEGDLLTITIRKEFDFGNLHQDWAQSVLTQHPGPFREVRLDLSACGLVSSTFFAGLIQLHHAYTSKGAQPLVLDRVDARVVRNLTMLHLAGMFTIKAR